MCVAWEEEREKKTSFFWLLELLGYRPRCKEKKMRWVGLLDADLPLLPHVRAPVPVSSPRERVGYRR